MARWVTGLIGLTDLEHVLRLDMRWRRHCGGLSAQSGDERRQVYTRSLETVDKSVLEMTLEMLVTRNRR